MIIISNSLSKTADEGCVKVAVSLVKRLKEKENDTYVISFERKSDISDNHLELNKLLVSKELKKIIKDKKERVLYFPFPARPIATALRIFTLSRYSKCGLDVLVSMQTKIDAISKLILKLSGANFLLLSRDACERFKAIVGEKRVTYLKTGVDTKKFLPVSADEQIELKKKYGFDPEKPLILHVGHLNRGRNIAELTKISNDYQVLLVVSTLTKNEQDEELRAELLSNANIRIIDSYLPNIQEVFAMCDVYFFPVIEYGKCIDVPLSCMEAASCNKPVVTTKYGELKAFEDKEGFYFIDSFDDTSINDLIDKALSSKNCISRESVLDYDWDNAICVLRK